MGKEIIWTIVVFAAVTVAIVTLAGCVTQDDVYVREQVYTRAEIDAINAEVQCRANSRSLLQLYRCEVRR
jgi:outer membrane murein-binding lipoprotein Lpp